MKWNARRAVFRQAQKQLQGRGTVMNLPAITFSKKTLPKNKFAMALFFVAVAFELPARQIHQASTQKRIRNKMQIFGNYFAKYFRNFLFPCARRAKKKIFSRQCCSNSISQYCLHIFLVWRLIQLMNKFMTIKI